MKARDEEMEEVIKEWEDLYGFLNRKTIYEEKLEHSFKYGWNFKAFVPHYLLSVRKKSLTEQSFLKIIWKISI
jgi:hypothetical protein